MQEIPIKIDIIAIITIMGVFLGVFLAVLLFIKSWKKNTPNMLMGLFLLSISLMMLEGWLNYTGYIFQYLWLTNFSEPLNFFVPPVLFLFVVMQFRKNFKRSYLLHFIPFLIWLGYCCFYFAQSDVLKYNNNIEVLQLDLPIVDNVEVESLVPLGLRDYTNHLTGLSFLVYMILILRFLLKKSRELGENFWTTKNERLVSSRNSTYHLIAVIVIFLVVKFTFGNNDLGDHFIYIYITFMIASTMIQIMNRSTYFDEVSTFFEGPIPKYRKSSLDDDQKDRIVNSLRTEMIQNKYFIKSTASLSDLSRNIGESSHHVSQVINEKLGLSFFEYLAKHKVKEAKNILQTELGKKLTIEEIAERVGYNSKSAFNTAFKKFTSQTPSEFRKG